MAITGIGLDQRFVGSAADRREKAVYILEKYLARAKAGEIDSVIVLGLKPGVSEGLCSLVLDEEQSDTMISHLFEIVVELDAAYPDESTSLKAVPNG